MNPTTVKKKKRSATLINTATLLMTFTIGSQFLGLLRTKLVNANFSALGPHSTDAYFAAFNIPDFFFFTVAAGALGVAFMPVLADRLHKGDHQGMWELSSSLLNLLAVIMAVVGLIIFIFAKPLVQYVVAPNMSPAQLDTTVTIMRFLAFNPLIFTITGILTSMQQTVGRFFFYALSPLFYNLSIIISIYLFKGNIGIIGLGIGALAGALLQLVIVLLGMPRLHYHWHPNILWKSPDFRTILRQLPPRSMDQGIDQLESIIETHFARALGTGFISYYNNAYIMSTAPIFLIGTAISTAAFPRMNARLSQGRPDLFRKDFLKILKAMIWISLPVIIIGYFTRGYLARLIFSRDAPEISAIFGYLAGSIFFGILYTLISRWYYAQKDTKTPLFVSIGAIILDVILVATMARASSYGIAGLALAQSIVSMAEVLVLLTIMVIRDNRLFDRQFLSGLVRIVAVSGFSLMTGYVMVSFFPLGVNDRGFLTLGGKVFFIAVVVILTHIGISYLFGIEEVQPIFVRLKRIITKPIQIEF